MKNNDLLIFLKNNYSIGKINSVSQLSCGPNSENYLIKSNKNYVLRNYSKNSKIPKIEKMCQILELCLNHGIKVPHPIKNHKGKFTDQKRNLFLTNYYEGEKYRGTTNELKAVAKSIALLHNVLEETKISYKFHTYQHYYRILTKDELSKIEKLITKKNKKDKIDKTIFQNINFLKNILIKEKEIFELIESLKFKKQLIHDDLHPGNILFKKNRVLAILDFNSMRNGYRIEDVAFASIRFSYNQYSKLEKITQRLNLFVDTYQNYCSIEEDQINMLGNFFIYKILGRLGYILRMRYFRNSNLWITDLEKNINFLKLGIRLRLA